MSADWLEVNEDVVVVFPSEGDRSAMRQFCWLVPQHLSGLQVNFVLTPSIVKYEERPGATSLADVDDGADHMGVKLEEIFSIKSDQTRPDQTLSTWVASQDPVLYLRIP